MVILSEQITIFEAFNDVMLPEQTENITTEIVENLIVTTVPVEEIYIGQKVKICLPKDTESEEYLYLKYYATPYLYKVGEISAISKASNGKTIYEVDFHGEKFLFHIEGLYLL
ncbi:MAG: hypothetical protein KBT36_09600 [Kurthia sp.]|nr:hypothetical protein [Candidatus Kurthia equi]